MVLSHLPMSQIALLFTCQGLKLWFTVAGGLRTNTGRQVNDTIWISLESRTTYCQVQVYYAQVVSYRSNHLWQVVYVQQYILRISLPRLAIYLVPLLSRRFENISAVDQTENISIVTSCSLLNPRLFIETIYPARSSCAWQQCSLMRSNCTFNIRYINERMLTSTTIQ